MLHPDSHRETSGFAFSFSSSSQPLIRVHPRSSLLILFLATCSRLPDTASANAPKCPKNLKCPPREHLHNHLARNNLQLAARAFSENLWAVVYLTYLAGPRYVITVRLMLFLLPLLLLNPQSAIVNPQLNESLPTSSPLLAPCFEHRFRRKEFFFLPRPFFSCFFTPAPGS